MLCVESDQESNLCICIGHFSAAVFIPAARWGLGIRHHLLAVAKESLSRMQVASWANTKAFGENKQTNKKPWFKMIQIPQSFLLCEWHSYFTRVQYSLRKERDSFGYIDFITCMESDSTPALNCPAVAVLWVSIRWSIEGVYWKCVLEPFYYSLKQWRFLRGRISREPASAPKEPILW